jgi:hypothetical protein
MLMPSLGKGSSWSAAPPPPPPLQLARPAAEFFLDAGATNSD